MGAEKKKSDFTKSEKEKETETAKNMTDEIDLGDADDSSGNLGMDNFKSKKDDAKLPSEKGRIEEL